MKRMNKTSSNNRFAAILRCNDGASIVLVTIIAILVITGIIILRTTTSALWASADKQLNQDQAYEMATSMGNSLDVLIVNKHQIDLEHSTGTILNTTIADLPDGKITATVTPSNNVYIVTVESTVADATYVYTAKYTGSGYNYTRQY